MKTQLIINNELINNEWALVVPEISIENVKKQAGKVVQFKTTGEEILAMRILKKPFFLRQAKFYCHSNYISSKRKN